MNTIDDELQSIFDTMYEEFEMTGVFDEAAAIRTIKRLILQSRIGAYQEFADTAARHLAVQRIPNSWVYDIRTHLSTPHRTLTKELEEV